MNRLVWTIFVYSSTSELSPASLGECLRIVTIASVDLRPGVGNEVEHVSANLVPHSP
jgi:hypothetical protein